MAGTGLERTRHAMQVAQNPAVEEVARILRERARRLARPLDAPAETGETLEILAFSLAGERYGIETRYVHEVVAPPDLTPVPGTPPFVRGVFNQRGRILAVVDLRGLVGLARQRPGEASRVAVVETGGMLFGLHADAVEGIYRVAMANLAPPPAGSGTTGVHLLGVTADMIGVLDLAAIARDPAFSVNEPA